MLASLEGRGKREEAGKREEGRGASERPRRSGPASHRIAAHAAHDQLGLFAAVPHPAVERLKGVDVNALTPLQALTLLAELAETAREEGEGRGKR